MKIKVFTILLSSVLSYSTIANSADDFGNSCSQASLTSNGVTKSGTINTAGDFDFFKFVYSSPGAVTFYTSGSTDTYGSLLNSNCTIIKSDNDAGDGSNFNFMYLVKAGTYYVSVRHKSTSGVGSYNLTNFFSSGEKYIFYPLSKDLIVNKSSAKLSNPIASQVFSKTHLGQDILATVDTIIYSIGEGIVKYNHTNPSDTTLFKKYWNSVLVIYYPAIDRHVYYGHINSSLAFGTWVQKGQAIGKIKPSYADGDIRTPANDHLHLGIKKDLVTSNWGYTTSGTSLTTLENNGWRDPRRFFNATDY